MLMKTTSIFLLCFLWILAAGGPSQAQSPKTRLRIAVSTTEPHNTPLWVGKDKGFFDKYGLDVQMVFVSGGSLVSQMLAAGEIQIAAAAPASLVSLIAGGERIVMFLGLSNTSPFTLVTQPNIKKAADLKGKRLGTARFGGSSYISAMIALNYLGLNPRRDRITIMQTGLDPERVAALESKAIDAAMLQRLATKIMVGKGYYPLLDLNKAKIPYQNTVLAARKDFITANSKVMENFVRATVEAYGYIFNKENKQAVKAVIAKNLRMRNIEDAEDYYEGALEELDRKPYPTVEGLRTVLKFVSEQNPKAASLKAEDLIDSSLLKKLDDEGFFQKVYGGGK
jgi:ABC-type nitrate/sulfonate/bicarbonate transport system substrate-binding protein